MSLFPCLDVHESDFNVAEVHHTIIEHLSSLKAHFEQYFPWFETDLFEWVRNPFSDLSIGNSLLRGKPEEQLADLS